MNHSEAGLTWRIPVTVSLSVNQHTEWALRFIAFSAATVILIGIITSKRIYDRDGREPPVYPYTVPFLGHTFPFLRNSEALITRAREFFGDNRSPFSIVLGGETFHIVTDPRDVASVYKNTSALSFEIFLRKTMLEFGSTQWGVDRILGPPMSRSGRTQGKSVAEVAHYLQVQQTSKTDLTCLGDHIARCFHHDLTHSTRENTKFYVKNGSKLAVSLKAWTQQIFIRAGQDAYFGPKLDELSPDLPLNLIRFDELSWQVFYHYPLALRREGTSLANKIRTAMKKYFELPRSQRPAKAWFVGALEDECRGVGLDTEEIASQMLFLYWGINTNISKMGFWMIAHALFAPHLVDMIRDETAPAFGNGDIPNGDYISNAQRCPRLNAFWLECLRLASSSTALRYVTEDTLIGGKKLREGHTILMSARQLHHNTSSAAFGDDAAIFNDERFLNNTRLERNLSFRPFGGGKTLCPGRHLAKHMALTFVALVFREFDVTLAKEQPFPAYEEDKPTIGIISGKEDLLISLRARDRRQGM